jgi:hypothetical protein
VWVSHVRGSKSKWEKKSAGVEEKKYICAKMYKSAGAHAHERIWVKF